jgi:hypothetical protein
MTAVWLHGDTMKTVKLTFRDRFGVEPPRKATLLGWEKCDFATGSVKDRPRGGRPITRRETYHPVAASVTQSLVKFTRRSSAGNP